MAQQYIRIERSTGVITVIGPFPDEAAADLAITSSSVVENECQQDCLDAWYDAVPPRTGEELMTIDMANSDHTGRPQTATCVHCGRAIECDGNGGTWIDPDATGDDNVWRETCDQHDTFDARHEPAEAGLRVVEYPVAQIVT